jgi:hypothetical protein
MNIRSGITISLFSLLSFSILSLANAQNSAPVADAGQDQTAWINQFRAPDMAQVPMQQKEP